MTQTQQADWLRKHGFIIGIRDARLNRAFKGSYMVTEQFTEPLTPTDDGRNGPWCIVGDDINNLINLAFHYHFKDNA